MKILVTGDRKWDDLETMSAVLSTYGSDIILIHGDADGADTMASVIGKALNWEIRPYPADWKRYGRKAGPIRNRQMLDTEQPDLVLAFHKNIAESKGTKDMVMYAKSKNVPVIIVEQHVINATFA